MKISTIERSSSTTRSFSRGRSVEGPAERLAGNGVTGCVLMASSVHRRAERRRRVGRALGAVPAGALGHAPRVVGLADQLHLGAAVARTAHGAPAHGSAPATARG